MTKVLGIKQHTLQNGLVFSGLGSILIFLFNLISPQGSFYLQFFSHILSKLFLFFLICWLISHKEKIYFLFNKVRYSFILFKKIHVKRLSLYLKIFILFSISLITSIYVIEPYLNGYNIILQFKNILLVLLITGIFLFLYLQQTTRPTSHPLSISKDSIEKNTSFDYILFFLVLSSFLFFTLTHLGQFISVDEPKWLYTRVPQLFEALMNHDWAKTYINDKPGIIPAFISGFVNFFIDPSTLSPFIIEKYLFWWRFPIVIFNALLLFLNYFFLKRLFTKTLSLIIILLIWLNPVLIGISQIVNPDATLWSLGLLTLINFLLYLQSGKSKYVLFTGIFFGLSLLSKYFISIYYLLFFIIIYFGYITSLDREQFYKRCWGLIQIYFISILVYGLFLPATWWNVSLLLKGTIGAGILASNKIILFVFLLLIIIEDFVLNGVIINFLKKHLNISLWIQKILSYGFFIFFSFLIFNIFTNYYLFDLNSFISGYSKMSDTPLRTLLASGYSFLLTFSPLLLIALIPYTTKINQNNRFIITNLQMICLVYVAGSALNRFFIGIRYETILIPLFCIIAAIQFDSLFKKSKVFFITLFTTSFLILFYISPFYLHYTNFLNLQHSNIVDTGGYGGYEIANKLNSLPNASNLRVWTDKEGFKDFFVGHTYWRSSSNPFDPENKIDYMVLTSGGKNKFSKALKNNKHTNFYYFLASETPLLSFYEEKNPIYSFCIHKNNCLKVIKMNDVNQ